MDTSQGLEDLNIITTVLSGNTESFEILIDKYRFRLISLLSKRLPHYLVEDALQETCIGAYRSLATYASQGPFLHWLLRIAERSASRILKRENAMCACLELSTINNLFGIEDESALYDNDSKDLLNKALNSLKTADRAVMILLYIQDCTVNEVATQLGWTEVKVRVRAYRCRKLLKTLLIDMAC